MLYIDGSFSISHPITHDHWLAAMAEGFVKEWGHSERARAHNCVLTTVCVWHCAAHCKNQPIVCRYTILSHRRSQPVTNCQRSYAFHSLYVIRVINTSISRNPKASLCTPSICQVRVRLCGSDSALSLQGPERVIITWLATVLQRLGTGFGRMDFPDQTEMLMGWDE